MSFLGLTSVYLVNIQPNSKFHPPPHQNFLDPLLSARSSFFVEPPPLKYAGCAFGLAPGLHSSKEMLQ